MRLKDLHILPRVSDSWSYLYVEHCRIDQDARAISLHDATGKTMVPCASLSLLMLGPGTSITHAAIQTLADNGCLVAWVGEEGVRFYAQGMGETRSATNTLRQAMLWSDPELHLQVVRRMYEIRFGHPIDPNTSLKQIRGMEGARVRGAYLQLSKETGVEWKGRDYSSKSWHSNDAINRAISAANSCLYGICHAAIVSAGYSTALGFIHTGKMLSFVYDVADLYKTEISMPAAFYAVAEGGASLESRVRRKCRDILRETRLLARIVEDIDTVLNVDSPIPHKYQSPYDSDPGVPGGWWDPEAREIQGGYNAARTPGPEDPGEADT